MGDLLGKGLFNTPPPSLFKKYNLKITKGPLSHTIKCAIDILILLRISVKFSHPLTIKRNQWKLAPSTF